MGSNFPFFTTWNPYNCDPIFCRNATIVFLPTLVRQGARGANGQQDSWFEPLFVDDLPLCSACVDTTTNSRRYTTVIAPITQSSSKTGSCCWKRMVDPLRLARVHIIIFIDYSKKQLDPTVLDGEVWISTLSSAYIYSADAIILPSLGQKCLSFTPTFLAWTTSSSS